MHIHQAHFTPVRNFTERGVFKTLLLENPRIKSEGVALIDASSGATTTYKDLISSSLRFGSGISKQLPPGSTLLISSQNSTVYPSLLFGALAAGVIASTANPAYTPSELSHQILDSDAKLILASSDLREVAREAAHLAGLSEGMIFITPGVDGRIVLAGQVRSYLELSGEDGFEPLEIKNPGETIAYLPYSSGTTGKPKGVQLSHRNVECIAQQVRQTPLMASKEITLGCLPIFHAYGLIILLHQSMFNGGTICLMPEFTLEGYCLAVQKYRATVGLIVPPIALALAKHPIVEQYDLSSLKHLICGAAPLSPELETTLVKRLHGRTKVSQGYGMTETTAVCLLPVNDSPVNGSCGKLVANMEARLIDEEGRDVAAGQVGELWVRGPNIMMETVTPDGWLKTGDVAFRSPQGDYIIVDRRKELIKTNAFQVAPAELEAILISCPYVLDCAVIGIWSPEKKSEFPRVYVVLEPSAHNEPDVQTKIAEYLASRVAPYKRLGAGVFLIDEIPKSPSGKILRKDLRVVAAKEAQKEGSKL